MLALAPSPNSSLLINRSLHAATVCKLNFLACLSSDNRVSVAATMYLKISNILQRPGYS